MDEDDDRLSGTVSREPLRQIDGVMPSVSGQSKGQNMQGSIFYERSVVGHEQNIPPKADEPLDGSYNIESARQIDRPPL